MKDMKYQSSYLVTVLDKGEIEDIKYAIVSYGTHPCAYIGVPKELKDIEFECHGGITFREDELTFNPIVTENIYWIGWDYCHCFDYAGHYESNNKKWTTKEILEEVKEVIKNIKESN